MKTETRLAIVAIGWAVVFLVLTQGVLAGSTLDYGSLTGTPFEGTVTYIAFLSESNGDEILTEDGYNSWLGPDQGYQSGYWWLGVANLDTENNGDEVQIYFTGIGEQAGKGGSLTFNWDGVGGFTDHGVVAFVTSESPATPTDLSAAPAGEGSVRLTWNDNTGGTATYRLYRSTQGSGSLAETSNGHYYRIEPFDYECTGGICTGLDTTAVPDKNWYIVVAEEGSLSGHSNESYTVPTAVTLVDFSASATDIGIRLDWETASESDLLGFNLYRAEDPGGPTVLLNGALIPGEALSPAMGAAYTWLDESAVAGVRYYYWLEVVSIHGPTTMHGPVSATMGWCTLYLPIVLRLP